MQVKEWLGEDNTLGIDIWERKYRHKNESFDEWVDRISGKDEEVKKLIIQKKFLFGGRVLANRGTDTSGSYFNCYSHGYVKDDYKDIMQTASNIGLTFKYQGGQGLSLSKLRPKGSPIGSEYTSDGIVPFIKIYNEVTAGTSQGGSRKGALMISLDARHKESSEFITIKAGQGIVEKANLSLEIDDTFMSAVEEFYKTGKEITLHEVREYSGHSIEYDIIPIKIFKLMVETCYEWGDPACLFVDRFRNYNLMEFDDNYIIETSNPCGEQPLPRHGACCLASINLAEFVLNPFTDNARFDEDGFTNAIITGITALDKLIDENYYRHPLKEQQEMSFNYRNIGLGVFGYGSMLMKAGMKYGSKEAKDFTNFLFERLFKVSVLASNNLSRQLGSFPKYTDIIWESNIIKNHFTSDEIETMKPFGLRNCSLVSIAPTGSLSTMFGETGGCEPEYAIKYTRRTTGMTNNEDHYYDVYCKTASEYLKNNIGKELPEYFIGSSDIYWKDRVETQSIMQNHVDTAISSTVNLPKQSTKDDVEQLYLNAWKMGLKGITIFRDGCSRLGILTTEIKDEEKPVKEKIGLERGEIESAPEGLVYEKYKITSGCGNLYLFVGVDKKGGRIYDCFTNTDGVGGCVVNTQCNSRLLSAGLRSGISVEYLIKQMEKAGTCPSYQYARGKGKNLSPGKSCTSAIAHILKKIKSDLDKNKGTDDGIETEYEPCPECKKPELTHEGGCVVCRSCGWSRCN